MMAQLSATRGAQVLNVDAWDGYAPARERLFRHIADHSIDNVVVLTGDIHSSWGSDLTLESVGCHASTTRRPAAAPSASSSSRPA